MIVLKKPFLSLNLKKKPPTFSVSSYLGESITKSIKYGIREVLAY